MSRIATRVATTLVVLLAWPALAAPPRWNVVDEASWIRFTGEQAGAGFTGGFEAFDAEVRFDPADLEASCARVVIETASASTGNRERDEVLTGPMWFDVEDHATAVFEAEEFERLGDRRFRAQGRLTMVGTTRDVAFTFTVERRGGQRRLQGETTLHRTRFELGRGEWRSTRWIADEVAVTVRLVANEVGGAASPRAPE